MKSVLQTWVMELPLRHQGTLLCAMRGCDEQPKFPLNATPRQLVAYLRLQVCNPADPREVDREPGSFMSDCFPSGWKASELGHLPLHWYTHLMHAYEVLAYKHPSIIVRTNGLIAYTRMVHSLHLEIESEENMDIRLTEDRLESGTVVS